MVADCLSRPEITAALSPSFTDYTELVLAQRDDPSIRELSQSMTSLNLCERAIPIQAFCYLETLVRENFAPSFQIHYEPQFLSACTTFPTQALRLLKSSSESDLCGRI